jgi:hypothetical protein
MAANIISSNPLFAGNQPMQDQMRNMMPAMLQQMQNPAVQGMMTNPESLQVQTIIILRVEILTFSVDDQCYYWYYILTIMVSISSFPKNGAESKWSLKYGFHKKSFILNATLVSCPFPSSL